MAQALRRTRYWLELNVGPCRAAVERTDGGRWWINGLWTEDNWLRETAPGRCEDGASLRRHGNVVTGAERKRGVLRSSALTLRREIPRPNVDRANRHFPGVKSSQAPRAMGRSSRRLVPELILTACTGSPRGPVEARRAAEIGARTTMRVAMHRVPVVRPREFGGCARGQAPRANGAWPRVTGAPSAKGLRAPGRAP
jgi:hypothetical protein